MAVDDAAAKTGLEGGVTAHGVAALDVEGTQAEVYRVTDPNDGEFRFVKVFYASTPIDRGALERAATIGEEHVPRMERSGTLVALGRERYFEVQEWIANGSLTNLVSQHPKGVDPELLYYVISDLFAAIDAMHGKQLAHLDLKPDNVLLRGYHPVDVVLADFGLAVISDLDVVTMSSIRGTDLYSPPESMALHGGFGWDYWSFGLIVATLATGHHPLEGLARPAVLQFKNSYTPFDFSGIADERLRSLCAGCTRYNIDIRWGADEVATWLRGGSPVVEDDFVVRTAGDDPRGASGDAADRDNTGVLFAGDRYHDPSDLAAALGADPDGATITLGDLARR